MELNPLNKSPSIEAVRNLKEATCGPVSAPSVTNDLSENIILTSLEGALAKNFLYLSD